MLRRTMRSLNEFYEKFDGRIMKQQLFAAAFFGSIGYLIAAAMAWPVYWYFYGETLTGSITAYAKALPVIVIDLIQNPALVMQYPAPQNFILAFIALEGTVVAYHLIKATLPQRETVVEGPNVSRDPYQASKELMKKSHSNNPGIHIHPEVRFPRQIEPRGFYIAGAPGSGKSQVFFQLLSEAVSQGDRIFCFDYKREYTEALDLFPKETALLAPWDDRTAAWDVAQDVANPEDASAMAKRLIPSQNSSNEFFPKAARQILTGIIRAAQARDESWGMENVWEIFQYSKNRKDEFVNIVTRHSPGAKEHLEDWKEGGTGTGSNVMQTMSTEVEMIRQLAYAEEQTNRSISMANWVNWKDGSPQAVILQGSPSYPTLQKSFTKNVINAIFRSIKDRPANEDSRIWLFLDEVPQIGQIDEIENLIELGRSRGIRMVFGTQNRNQIKNVYGESSMESWEAMIETKIIGRLKNTQDAKWASNLMGEQTVERTERVHRSDREGGSTTTKKQRETRPAVKPHEIRHLDDLHFYLPTGETIFKLRWPYFDAPDNHPGHQPADWLQGRQWKAQDNEDSNRESVTSVLEEMEESQTQ